MESAAAIGGNTTIATKRAKSMAWSVKFMSYFVGERRDFAALGSERLPFGSYPKGKGENPFARGQGGAAE